MIYTVTMNPCIDYTLRLNGIRPGETNRSDGEQIDCGGKGLNVSRLLAKLGEASVALGFTAGFTGEAIEKSVSDPLVRMDFIRLKTGYSRINVKLDGGETEINGRGPTVYSSDVEALYAKLDAVGKGDVAVFSGSVPLGAGSRAYANAAERLEGRGAHVIVDAAGKLLENCLPYSPFLIKPNRSELREIFGSDGDELKRARELQKAGAKNVLVTLDADGAFLLDSDGNVFTSPALCRAVTDTVGAGDATVAGFIFGYARGRGYEGAFRLACACAAAACEDVGLPEREAIERYAGKLP